MCASTLCALSGHVLNIDKKSSIADQANNSCMPEQSRWPQVIRPAHNKTSSAKTLTGQQY